MYVKLYKTPSKKIEVEKVLENEQTYDCIFYKDSAVNVEHPNVILGGVESFESISDYNYMYIPECKRYYFIDSNDGLTGKRVLISGSVDVLKTYASDIKNSTQLVIRQQYKKNMYLNDSNYPLKKKTAIIVENFGSSFTETNNFVLTTVGEGVDTP